MAVGEKVQCGLFGIKYVGHRGIIKPDGWCCISLRPYPRAEVTDPSSCLTWIG